MRAQGDVTRVAETLLDSPFLIAQDLLSLDGFAVQRLGWGVNLARGRDRVGLTFAVENLTDRYYREQFQFAPARGRSFTVGLNVGSASEVSCRRVGPLRSDRHDDPRDSVRAGDLPPLSRASRAPAPVVVGDRHRHLRRRHVHRSGDDADRVERADVPRVVHLGRAARRRAARAGHGLPAAVAPHRARADGGAADLRRRSRRWP